MKLFLALFLSVSAFAVEDDVAKLVRSVKQKKEELKAFREKVSMGDTCKLRDYVCFSRAVLEMVNGHSEEIVEARDILEPFFTRSVKEGFPPCSETCESTLRISHIKLYLDYLSKYGEQGKKDSRIPGYPTLPSVKARTYLALSAYGNILKAKDYLEQQLEKVDFGKVTKPELTNKKFFEEAIKKVDSDNLFNESVLCHIEEGDPIQFEILRGGMSGKKVEETYFEWFKAFSESHASKCKDRTPFIYRGTDKETREYYNEMRDRKLSAIYCSAGDFACVRNILRTVGIKYAEDVEKVSQKLTEFLNKSKVTPCDETCEAQSLVRLIQTWITYLSTYEREKLASTMDWNEFPQAKYSTIAEDVELYTTLKKVLTPLIAVYGKIDSQAIKDPGLKSELRSVGKDLSDFSSGKMLKDSVICTMEPWSATYDRYLSPYKDKKQNKKFEEAFVEFKNNICK